MQMETVCLIQMIAIIVPGIAIRTAVMEASIQIKDRHKQIKHPYLKQCRLQRAVAVHIVEKTIDHPSHIMAMRCIQLTILIEIFQRLLQFSNRTPAIFNHRICRFSIRTHRMECNRFLQRPLVQTISHSIPIKPTNRLDCMCNKIQHRPIIQITITTVITGTIIVMAAEMGTEIAIVVTKKLGIIGKTEHFDNNFHWNIRLNEQLI